MGLAFVKKPFDIAEFIHVVDDASTKAWGGLHDADPLGSPEASRPSPSGLDVVLKKVVQTGTAWRLRVVEPVSDQGAPVKTHADARLTVRGRLLLCERVD
jgi:hypothetical protein